MNKLIIIALAIASTSFGQVPIPPVSNTTTNTTPAEIPADWIEFMEIEFAPICRHCSETNYYKMQFAYTNVPTIDIELDFGMSTDLESWDTNKFALTFPADEQTEFFKLNDMKAKPTQPTELQSYDMGVLSSTNAPAE